LSGTALAVGNAEEDDCVGGDDFGFGSVVSLEPTEVLFDGLWVLAVSDFDRRCGDDDLWVDGTG
jgi:hypothetical protein